MQTCDKKNSYTFTGWLIFSHGVAVWTQQDVKNYVPRTSSQFESFLLHKHKNFFLILTIPLGNRKLGLKMTLTDVKWTRMVFSLFIYLRRKVRAPQSARVSSITDNYRGMTRSSF